MKRFIFFVLLVCAFGSAELSAQVKIGDTTASHDGAALHLESQDKWGLLLPRLELSDAAVWALNGTAVDGMMVFNTGASTSAGLAGKGVYVWYGNAWNLIPLRTSTRLVGAASESDNDLSAISREQSKTDNTEDDIPG